MLKSMTAFSSKQIHVERLIFLLEIRCLNSRHLDLRIGLPSGFLSIEEQIRTLIRSRISRGRIEFNMKYQNGEKNNGKVELDINLAINFFNLLSQLKQELNISEEIGLSHILTLREIMNYYSEPIDIESLKDAILAGVKDILDEIEEMREREGIFLEKEIENYLATIKDRIETIEELSEGLISAKKEQLEKRLSILLKGEEIDETRFLQEIAYLADKSDISEEITRLKSHLTQFKHYFKIREPVGRRLDFLIQEMVREINTIGAKASSAPISQEVVEIKNQLEKIREQVQNIE